MGCEAHTPGSAPSKSFELRAALPLQTPSSGAASHRSEVGTTAGRSKPAIAGLCFRFHFHGPWLVIPLPRPVHSVTRAPISEPRSFEDGQIALGASATLSLVYCRSPGGLAESLESGSYRPSFLHESFLCLKGGCNPQPSLNNCAHPRDCSRNAPHGSDEY